MTTSTRPGSPRLAGRARKTWLTAHIGFSVGWLGAAYCMLVLATTGLLADDRELRVACYELMHLFDRAVNIPLALAMLGTGLVVSLRTRWGLLRHRWVVTKFVASTLTLVLAPVLSVPRVEDAIAGLRDGADLGSIPLEIIAISVTVVTTLSLMTVISVFKPWGRTRRNPEGPRAKQRAQRAFVLTGDGPHGRCGNQLPGHVE